MSDIKQILDSTNEKEFLHLSSTFEAILNFVRDYIDDINLLHDKSSEYQTREINHAIHQLISGSRKLNDNCEKLLRTPNDVDERTAAFSSYRSCKSAINKLEPMIEKIEQDEHEALNKTSYN